LARKGSWSDMRRNFHKTEGWDSAMEKVYVLSGGLKKKGVWEEGKLGAG